MFFGADLFPKKTGTPFSLLTTDANRKNMNTYLLLRENHESGPYTLDELKALSLGNLDLIWIEGVSAHWDYATEFEELRPFVNKAPHKGIKRTTHRQPSNPAPSQVFVTLPQGTSRYGQERRTAVSDPAACSSREPQPEARREAALPAFPDRTEEKTVDRKFQFEPRISRRSGHWIMGLMGLLMFGAFTVKQLIEDDSVAPLTQAGSAIMPIQSLPEGSTPQKPADRTYQNAISTIEAPAKDEKKQAKKLTPAEIRHSVSVSNNKYKVGIFGGVDDLQLNVHNDSKQVLDKVNVQVTFLKPNGEVIRSEEYSVYSVAPQSTKILVVPPSRRGVKVKYRITGIESKESIVPASQV
ncbi:MAG: hypothetical protein JWP27_1792 [Flaviaesturariibacter sp.]|nr:hypothetical protein [Flaviaesturariibacter sp.]